jgi:hypothetical protein
MITPMNCTVNCVGITPTLSDIFIPIIESAYYILFPVSCFIIVSSFVVFLLYLIIQFINRGPPPYNE